MCLKYVLGMSQMTPEYRASLDFFNRLLDWKELEFLISATFIGFCVLVLVCRVEILTHYQGLLALRWRSVVWWLLAFGKKDNKTFLFL